MSSALLLKAALFLILLVLMGVFYFAYNMNTKSQKRAHVISVITKNADPSLEGKGDYKERHLAKQRAEISRKLKDAGKDEQKKKGSVSIREKLLMAGYEISPLKFWIISAVFASVFTGAIWFTKIPMIAKYLLAFVAFVGMPRMFLNRQIGKRQQKFLEEFADALEAMTRLLQAGMPVSEAIAMISREFRGPMREEMSRIYDDQKVGIRLGDAAERAAKRMPITEMKMFATAVNIQSETGSSLSEILMNLASVIRARFRLKRKVKALSSEAKASASIIAALPVLVTLGLYAVRPDYIGILFITQTGKMLLGGGICWMTIGVLMMKQMINFRV